MKISEIVQELCLTYKGKDCEIKALNNLKNAQKGEITYFKDKKFLNELKITKASAVIIEEKFADFICKDTTLIFSANPYLTMAYISQMLHKNHHTNSEKKPNISSKAIMGSHVTIGNGSIIEDNVVIKAGVVIGENVKIEQGTTIHPNAVIYDNSKIGKNCTLLANCVIGSDGFGYAHTNKGEHIKIIHSGNVILEDNVDVGANTTIDRGVFASTIIKKGTKIDNLVQIGHNCCLEEDCIIVSQVGLSGSTKLGRGVIMGGQSATSGHLSIGDYAIIAARGGVSKSLEGGKTYGGFPILLQKDWLKLQAKILKFFKSN